MPLLGVVEKKIIAENIGQAVRKIRIERGLSMQQLATLAEIEKSQIYRIENGKVDARVSTLYILAKVLNVRVQAFLE